MSYSKAAQGNSSSPPKDSEKKCSSPEEFERYSFPSSILAATTHRLVFTEIDRQDLKTLTAPNAARAYPANERYMKQEEIAKLHTLLEEVVWMCDVVLNTQIEDHVWSRFFKDVRYHFAIIKIFGYVRDIVWSLLERESPNATLPIFDSKRLKIQMVHSDYPVEPTRIADVDFTTNSIRLYSRFVNGWQGQHGPSAKELRLTRSGWSDIYRVCETRAGTLLHELGYITDVIPDDYADKQSKTDREVLQYFKKTESEKKYESEDSDYRTAYGVLNAKKLTELTRTDALAAAMNAENYLVFAAELCSVYLSNEFAGDAWISTNEILARVPTPRESRRSSW